MFAVFWRLIEGGEANLCDVTKREGEEARERARKELERAHPSSRRTGVVQLRTTLHYYLRCRRTMCASAREVIAE